EGMGEFHGRVPAGPGIGEPDPQPGARIRIAGQVVAGLAPLLAERDNVPLPVPPNPDVLHPAPPADARRPYDLPPRERSLLVVVRCPHNSSREDGVRTATRLQVSCTSGNGRYWT